MYVGRETTWVGKPEGAVEYSTLEAAGRKARELAAADMVVVLRYETPECELALNPAYCVTGAGHRGQTMGA